MPRIRSIKPEFAFDEEMAALPDSVQRFFVLLWTHCDKAGRCEDRPQKLRALICPYQPKFDAAGALAALAPKFLIRYKSPTGLPLIQVRTWTKHQRPHHTEPESPYPAPSSDEIRLDNGGTTVVTPLAPGLIREGKGEGEGECPSKPMDAGFTDFWKEYPRKVQKADAMKSWLKLKPDAVLLASIIAAVMRAPLSFVTS